MLGHASELDHEAPPPTHRSEIRFCPITFIVCITVFLRRVHHRGCVRPDSWDARMIDGMSRRFTSSSCCWPFLLSAAQSTMHGLRTCAPWWCSLLWLPPTSTLTGGGGGDLFLGTGILPLHLCVARAYIEHLAKGNISSRMKEGTVKGNRMEERIDTELVQRGANLKDAGEMDEAMITGRINSCLVSKGVIVVWAAPWCMVFEATHVGSVSRAPIQQVQAGGALCVKHHVAVGVWVALLTSGAADTFVRRRRLWHTSALSLATDFKTVSGRSTSAIVDSKPIVIGMHIVVLAIQRHQRQIAADNARRRRDAWLHGWWVLGRRQAFAWATLVSLTRASPRGEESGAPAASARLAPGHAHTGDNKGTARSIGGRGWHRQRVRSSVQEMEAKGRRGGDGWRRHQHRVSGRRYNDQGQPACWSHPLVVASGHLSSNPNDECTRSAKVTSVHVSEIQSIATATTSSPYLVVLWHHFGEGHGFIGTISVSASGDQHLLVREACVLGCVQPDLLLLLLVARVPDPQPLAAGHSCSLPVTVVHSVWDLDKPLSCGLEVPVWWPAQSIRGNSGGVYQPCDGERVLTTYTLEQWNMTSVAIVLWSMRGWQPIIQHHAGQCKLRVSRINTRRKARSPVWPSFAVPAAYCVLSFNKVNTTAVAICPVGHLG
ncbi:hypothetical protein PTSG_02602 [Salpingoeca rosetta]|uniref:Uncharacterized protein n=1 Tax=Salpingoeca rosetta (strain ATCC 50818 / BSB-021) TaxID=946362 RepID=F2U2S2_SALR5|nr:uncharacterized protein PTSG_02602 [Salpingoeca rosetta]EGD81916.1 hypothetical protein PTSG_02602 [Salpingoeca rosetta]|eukprot:XP_004996099.1 hypothetical protein PTSG_02602 [Salpingoeca rosetta]